MHNEVSAGIILWVRQANERRRYSVMLPLIGWAHTQNDLCIWRSLIFTMFLIPFQPKQYGWWFIFQLRNSSTILSNLTIHASWYFEWNVFKFPALCEGNPLMTDGFPKEEHCMQVTPLWYIADPIFVITMPVFKTGGEFLKYFVETEVLIWFLWYYLESKNYVF